MSFYSHFTSYLLGICKKTNANKLVISILRLCYYIKTDFYSYIPAVFQCTLVLMFKCEYINKNSDSCLLWQESFSIPIGRDGGNISNYN